MALDSSSMIAPRFGWRNTPDPAEAKFAVGRQLRLPAAPKSKARSYRTPRVHDQGDDNSVKTAWLHWFETAQGTVRPETDPPFPVVGALAAQSLYMAARAMKEGHLIDAYYWTRLDENVKAALYKIGPVVVGTSWYSGMVDPHPTGIVVPSGSEVGQHAWVVVGYDPTRGMYRGLNSWGAGWGQLGRFWISEHDFAQLLKDGSACVPVLAK